MGANAQTTVPTFTAGQILTADQQNQSAGTGVPVFATTVTRDAAFGGTGEKVLAQGQLCYLEATNVVQYYNGTSWATLAPAAAGALTLISATTIGTAVSSVTVSSAFSSTYENYLITVNGGVASTSITLGLQLGSTTTGYYSSGNYVTYTSATVNGDNQPNTTSFVYAGGGTTDTLDARIELFSPNLAKRTTYRATFARANTTSYYLNNGGYLNDATQYTAFTLTCSTGNMTGGTVRVYGYANS
jgi:hypothetical protein